MAVRPITKDYLLEQFRGFNTDILENRYLKQSDNISTFRGTFNTWADVPTNSSQYNSDLKGSTVPKTGDYIIVKQSKGYGTEMVGVNTTTHNALGKYLADDILTYTEGTLITSEVESALSGVVVEIYICYGINKFIYYGNFADDGRGSSATTLGWKPCIFNIEDIPFTQKQIENLNRDYSPPTSSEIDYDNTTSGLSATDIQSAVDEIAQDFQDGCDTIMQAVTAQGKTPVSNSPTDISNAIGDLIVLETGVKLVDYGFDYHWGYVSGALWKWEAMKYVPADSTNEANSLDIYPVVNGVSYCIFMGNEKGTRFRGVLVDTTPFNRRTDLSGTSVVNLADDKVTPFIQKRFTSDRDGYFLIQKDNAGTHNLKSFLCVESLAEGMSEATYNTTLASLYANAGIPN